LWQQIAGQIAQLAVENAAAPALAASVPIAGPIAAGLLLQLTKGRPEELKQLEHIREDTQALLEGPYNTAKEWLTESHNIVEPEEKKEAVEKALDYFMEANGLEQDPSYRKDLDVPSKHKKVHTRCGLIASVKPLTRGRSWKHEATLPRTVGRS